MKRHSVKCRSILYFAILMIAISASCSNINTAQSTPSIVPTSTPERLSLIDGALDACLLITPTEVESVLGIKVVSERRFAMIGATLCKYTSISDGKPIFQIFLFTDATLRKVHDSSSAVELYEMLKKSELELHKKIPEIKVEDIDNFGDQAYFQESVSNVVIHVLRNEIYYEFVARIVDVDGIGYDALMKLVKRALQRMP